MPATNVKSKWVNGNLVFYDSSGNEIMTIDGVNRKVSIPAAAEFTVGAVDIIDELQALTGLDTTELGYLDGVVAGTVTASKALVAGANKNLDGLAIADGGLALGAGAGTAVTATAAELNKLDGIASDAYPTTTKGVSFTEDGSGTSYTGTIAIPAGSILTNIQIMTTVLWDGTSAALDVGDDDDPNGYFEAINLKSTDLAVGEVIDIASSENWGGLNGAYLVAATGRKGNVTASNSGIWYGEANNIIGVVTPGGADGSAGRSFMFVTYAVPTLTASTNV